MTAPSVAPQFQMFECENPSCRLRFPTDLSINQFDCCPRCGSSMSKTDEPYKNYERPPEHKLVPTIALNLILDNLRSAQNVGSIFRTANGAGIRHIYCCGTTPTPEHPRVKKSSLGAEESTSWSYHPNSLLLIKELIDQGYVLLALESSRESTSLFDFPSNSLTQADLGIILGNEISGIDPQVLASSDIVLHIPMAGSKTSLNVAVSAGIALYWLINILKND